MIEYEDKMKEIVKEDMRDGPIPGWDEVRLRFKLDQLSLSQQKLLHAYYRAQRWFAEKGTRDKIEPKKPKRLMHAISPQLDVLESEETFEALKTSLIEDSDFEAFFASSVFENFEKENWSLIAGIASFIRKPIEEERRSLERRQEPAR